MQSILLLRNTMNALFEYIKNADDEIAKIFN